MIMKAFDSKDENDTTGAGVDMLDMSSKNERDVVIPNHSADLHLRGRWPDQIMMGT